MESYLKRRGKYRLRILNLLLHFEKGKFVPINKLKELHKQLYKTDMEPWNMHIFHKDGLIEFKKLQTDAWQYSDSTTQEAVFILSNENREIYKKDSVRILPAKYDSIKNQMKMIMSLTEVVDVQLGTIQLKLPFENLSNEILVIRAAAFLSSLFNGGEFSSDMITKVVNEGFLGDTNLKRNPESIKDAVNKILEMAPSEIPGEFAGFALQRKGDGFKWVKLENSNS